mgnify:FL=1
MERACERFLKGNWESLYNDAKKELTRLNEMASQLSSKQPAEPPANDDRSDQRKGRTALELCRKRQFRRAAAALRSKGVASGTAEEVVSDLSSLHPHETPPSGIFNGPAGQPKQRSFDFIDGYWLQKQIRASSRGGAVDLFGWDTREMWEGFLNDIEFLHTLAKVYFRPIAEGFTPVNHRRLFCGGRLIALSKAPKPGIRPICIGNAWRKIGRAHV